VGIGQIVSLSESDARLHESRPALPRYVASLRRAAVAFAARAGADELQLENIGVATSEAISNCVLHAYPDESAGGSVIVTAWMERGAIVVTVCDEGRGMLPRHDSPGLGLGLPLIERVTERFDIEDRLPEPGVRLRMQFSLRAS